ncbi:MAG: hypothetical protein KKH68_06180 [Proteobacteria bacterium]|nr:hypothetical protein [Pseudomonadota bacterium]
MPKVTIDILKNRLYLTIKDWDHSDMAAYVQDIEAACNALFFGFTCLIVLRKKGAVRQKDLDLLFRTTDLISAYGAVRLVVVNDSHADSPTTWTNLVYVPNYIPAAITPSIAEGEDILDGAMPEVYASMPLQTAKTGMNLRTYNTAGTGRQIASYPG